MLQKDFEPRLNVSHVTDTRLESLQRVLRTMSSLFLPVVKSAVHALTLSSIALVLLHVLHQSSFITSTVVDETVASLLDYADHLSWSSASANSYLRSSGLQVFNPEGYHGPGQTWFSSTGPTSTGAAPPQSGGFFEGWYYKLHQADGASTIIIPGVIYTEMTSAPSGSKSDDAEGYAFVMCANPTKTEESERYTLHKYPFKSFSALRNGSSWKVTIGPNEFTSNSIKLDLDAPGQRVFGYVKGDSTEQWLSTMLLPDVMGWFAWLPGMECRHGVVSLASSLSGMFELNGEKRSFEGGLGYIEKDWGTSFPRTWVWIQASHFESASTQIGTGPNKPVRATLLLSVASIPFPSDTLELFRFRGFLGGLWLPDNGGLYRFATYTGAVVERLQVSQDQSHVELSIRSAQYRILVEASGNRNASVVLHGPKPGGKFEQYVQEMLDAQVSVKLVKRSNDEVIFSGVAKLGGLELESMEPGGIQLLESN